MQISEYIKKQPLVGLALAVAGGLVMAHLALKIMNYVYEEYIERDLQEAIVYTLIVAIVGFLLYRYGKRIGSILNRNLGAIVCTGLAIWAISVFVIIMARYSH